MPPRDDVLNQRERECLIDNLLVRIHFIIEMIWWTGLAPWEFEFLVLNHEYLASIDRIGVGSPDLLSHSGDTAPCRMTRVTLHSHVRSSYTGLYPQSHLYIRNGRTPRSRKKKTTIPRMAVARSETTEGLATCPAREISFVLPNNQRQHRTLHIQKNVLPYALC